MKNIYSTLCIFLVITLFGCISCEMTDENMKSISVGAYTGDSARLGIYAPFTLTTDLTVLSEAERKMIPLLIEAARVMDTLFWKQAFGDPAPFLQSIESEEVREFEGDEKGVGDRPRADQGGDENIPGEAGQPACQRVAADRGDVAQHRHGERL